MGSSLMIMDRIFGIPLMLLACYHGKLHAECTAVRTQKFRSVFDSKDPSSFKKRRDNMSKPVDLDPRQARTTRAAKRGY